MQSSTTAPPVLPPPWNGRIDANESFVDVTRGLAQTDPLLATAIAEEALRQAESRGDAAGAARAMLCLASFRKSRGLPGYAQAFEEAFRRADGVPDDALRARVLVARLGQWADQGRHAEALAVGQEAIELALALGRSDLLARAARTTANVMDMIGEHELALAMLHDVHSAPSAHSPEAAGEKAHTDNNEAVTWLNFARALREEGRESEARQAFARGRECAQRAMASAGALKSQHLTVSVFDTLMELLREQGDLATARALLAGIEQTCEGMAERGTFAWGCYHLNAAALELDAGPTDAHALLDRLHQIERIDDPMFTHGELRLRLLALLARTSEACGDASAALGYHRKWTELQLQARSVAARERAKAVRHTQLALRGESMEFITHDLRSPLTATLQHLDSLATEPMSEAARQKANQAARTARRALDIADQALNLMRAEYMQPAELGALDLSALVDDVCEHMAPPPHVGATLARAIEPGLRVCGERSLLARALGNLIDNALRHSPRGAAVQVVAERRDDLIALSVIDRGPGVPGSTRRRLFARYATGRADQGHGLGLALVSRVARLHGARIEVQSAEGEGTRITLHLPPLDG